MEAKQKVYIRSIDTLRAISILGVVLIHTTTRILETSGYQLTNYVSTLFLNQFARFAVPLFFLISGFVLELNYDYHLNYFAYLKKRLGRIFIPYVFWSLVYYFLIYTQNRDTFITALLTGSSSYQLYFIPTLLIFYLVFPLLHKVYKVIANVPVLLILGGIQMFLMHQDYTVQQFAFVDPLRISILGYFVFILGIVAARNRDKISKIISKIKLMLIPIIGYLVFFIFEEGKNRYFQTYNIEAFYSQWRISVLIYTLVLAALLFYIFEQPKFQSKVVEKMSKLSFLVFFIHVLILEASWNLFGKFMFSALMFTKPGFDILFFGVVSGVSFGVAYLIHKIPNLNKLTG